MLYEEGKKSKQKRWGEIITHEAREIFDTNYDFQFIKK